MHQIPDNIAQDSLSDHAVMMVEDIKEVLQTWRRKPHKLCSQEVRFHILVITRLTIITMAIIIITTLHRARKSRWNAAPGCCCRGFVIELSVNPEIAVIHHELQFQKGINYYMVSPNTNKISVVTLSRSISSHPKLNPRCV